MSESEDIYEWMAKQKFPLDRAGVEKVSSAKLVELKESGIKYVSVLGCGGSEKDGSASDCEVCLAMLDEKIEIEFASPLPLPGCDKEFCKCIYIARE